MSADEWPPLSGRRVIAALCGGPCAAVCRRVPSCAAVCPLSGRLSDAAD